MRRKSTRNSGKSPEKVKQPETPVRKSKRNSKRRRKSTTSESENSEDEIDVKPDSCTEQLQNQKDILNTDEAIEKMTSEKEDTLGKPPEAPEKKIKLRRNKTSTPDEDDISDKSLRRSRRRGSPKVDESTYKEEDEDNNLGKGKSKGKHKSKIDKSQPQSESEKHTESDISENVQVTPLSPHTNIDNPVDKEPINSELEKTPITEENSEHKENAEHITETNLEEISAKNIVNLSSNDLQKHNEQTVVDCSTEDSKQNTSSSVTPSSEKETKGVECIEPINCPCSPNNEVIEINKTENTGQGKILQSTNNSNEEERCNDKNIDTLEEKVSSDDKNIAEEKPVEKTENSSELSSQTQVDVQPENLSADTAMTNEDFKSVIDSKLTSEEKKSKENIVDQTILMEVDESINEGIVQEPESSIQEFKVNEKPKVQKQKIIISRTRRTGSDQSAEIVKRRRMWGNTGIGLDLISSTMMQIDITTIQAICPTMHLIDETEVKLEVTSRNRRKSSVEHRERKKSERKISLGDSDHPFYDSQISENSLKSEDNLEQEIDNSNIIAMNRKISIVDDSASKLKPPPSPARNTVSEVLYITNLVRPFTLKQLKELLERTGKIIENGFWTDRIKSKCYVQYQSINEAESTRNALHGVHWPIGNGKKLIIDYATPEDLENARNPPPPQQPDIIPELPKNDKENQEPPKKIKHEEEQKVREKEKEKRRHEHVREWDVGKEDVPRGRSRSQERHDRHKRRHSRNTPSPIEDFISKKHKKSEEQIPQKLMDDLFQKTKSTPSIYWQPLTPVEIATKQQQRLERMAEHKRRMEETSRNRADFGRGGPYRRRYD